MSITVEIVEANAEINVQVDDLRVLKVNRKTEAQLIAQAAASGLIADELYFITDTNKIAYALTASTFAYIEAVAAAAWGFISGTLSNQTDLQNALNAKMTGNSAITAGTKTKITYDTKGLVTSGADATTADIAASADKNYMTDAEVSKLSGIQAGATANSLDSTLLNRANHTGTQAANTISDFQSAVAANSAVTANTAKVSNATHSGDAVGDGALTLQPAAITGKSAATVASGDLVLISDVDDSSNLKKVTAGAIAALASAGITSWGAITGTLADQTDLNSALGGKVAANSAITGATKTKITYDAKGLITAGADATTADIADSTDKRYVTDAELVVIGNTSGTNTGDQVLPTRASLALDTTDTVTFANLSGTNTGDQDLSGLMVKASNLSDLVDASTARTNLGVAIGTHVQAYNANLTKRNIFVNIDGGGSAITTGIVADVVVPFDMTITGWTILSDQTGSIVVDIWKDSYANYPPDVADTITGTEKPTLSSASKNQDNALSSWTTAITAGDILRFNVDSAATVQRVTLIIEGVLS
jgi:hypothetical protein